MITVVEFIVFVVTICAHVAFLGILYAWESSRSVRTLRTAFVFFLVWILGEFVAAQMADVSWRLWIQRTSGGFGIATSSIFMRFVYALRYKKYDLIFYVMTTVIGISSILYVTTGLGLNSVANLGNMHVAQFGILFWAMLFAVVVNWVLIAWVMYRAKCELPDYESARRKSIVLLQIATTVLSFLGIVGFIWSSLFWEKSLFFRYVPLLSTVFIPFFMIAFYRYGFLTTGIEGLARDLFENATDGIIVTDEAYIVREINPEALRFLNCTRDAAETVPLRKLLNLPAHEALMPRYELCPGDVAGLQKYLAVSVTPVTTHVGVRLNLVVLLDMTDEKAAEDTANRSREDFENEILLRTEELIELQEKEAVGAMAGSIAHDFNNLLAAVLGFSTAAHQDVPDGSPLKRDLEEILASARQARALVQQLLLFSRRQKSRRVKMDVAEMVTSSIPLIRSSLPPNVVFSCDIPSEPTFVMANRTDLAQVLMNLSTNAVQAMEKLDGELHVSLEVDATLADTVFYVGHAVGDNNIRLTVRDIGTGIGEDIRPHVFEPFFSTRKNAIGFGLSTAYRIVTENAGGISIEDNRPAGAMVSVWLPRLAGDEVDERDLGIELTGGEHILVVDDDERMLRLIVRLLTSVGYRITTFNDPGRALSAFRRTPGAFDLVITDFAMPGMSGAELGRLLLEERSDIPVLMVSGNASVDDVVQAQDEGIGYYLPKPFSREELLVVVRRILNDHRRPSIIP
jgi:signal transduction histidine kinase/CheY-like chemotaxis protein